MKQILLVCIIILIVSLFLMVMKNYYKGLKYNYLVILNFKRQVAYNSLSSSKKVSNPS